MTSAPLGLSDDELLRQDRWLRELVRGLVAESDVEDVVQETWASALRRRAGVARPRAWLSVVARNFARRRARSAGRRDAREAAAARPEAVPSAAEALELLELQERIVAAVRGLREPYREALLLRYTLGLTAEEIAGRSGAQASAVRQRLKRGRDLVREQLEAQVGPDWSGLPALALWLAPGVIPMKKSVLPLALLGSVLGLAGVARLWLPAPESEGGGPGGGSVSIGTEPAVTLPDVIATPRADAAPQAQGTHGADQQRILGRVVDVRGRPLTGVGVSFVERAPREVGPEGLDVAEPDTTSDANGSFELAGDGRVGRLVPAADYVTLAFRWRSEVQDEGLLIVAPAVTLAGTVSDARGLPLAGVSVRPLGIDLRAYPDVLEGLISMAWKESETDAQGRFEHRDLPANLGRLRFEKVGYQAVEVPLGAFDDPALAVTLEADPWGWVLHGVVRSPEGAPVEGARVGLGDSVVRSDALGRYELRFASEVAPAAEAPLWVAASPWCTPFERRFGARLLAAEGGRLEHDLAFEAETVAIEGTLLDAEGEPAAGVLVYPWGREELADGASPEDLGAPEDAELLDVGQPLRVWERTGEDGRFRLEGLHPGEYLLRLFDRERFAAHTSDPLPSGGPPVVLRLPADFVRARLSGRVVDASGEGVAGVTLTPQLLVHTSRQSSRARGNGSRFTADDEGYFELTDVSGGSLGIALHGDSILPVTRHLAAGSPVEGVELVVERKRHFRLVLTGTRAAATGFRVLDPAGEPLVVVAMEGAAMTSASWRFVRGEGTQTLAVGSSAATLVLYDGGMQEVGRVPLELRGDGVHEIQW